MKSFVSGYGKLSSRANAFDQFPKFDRLAIRDIVFFTKRARRRLGAQQKRIHNIFDVGEVNDIFAITQNGKPA